MRVIKNLFTSRRHVGASFAACVLMLVAGVASAQGLVDDEDTHLWLHLNGEVAVSHSVVLFAQFQPRWNENATHLDVLVTRVGAQLRPAPWLQVSGAYGVLSRRTGAGTLNERQVYQQATLNLPRVGGWTAQFRYRQDQRFAGQWPDASHRARGQLRVIRPMPKRLRSVLVLHDELFYTVDDTRPGPARGVDQNRLFTGVQRQLTGALSVETGYMWQHLLARGDRPQRDNHIALVQFLLRARG